MKFGRTYSVIVEGRSRSWTFGYPISCNLRVSSDGTPTCNKGHFNFINLPENMRNDLTKDYFDFPTYRRIVFAAGYKQDNQLAVIFTGNIFYCWSYRKGPDWITELECLDGGYAVENGSIEASFGTAADNEQILRAMVLAMPHVTVGSISKGLEIPTRSRGMVVSGNAWDEIVRRILPQNAQAFISNEVVHVIAQNEYLPSQGAVDTLSPDNGMIGSPKRQENLTVVTMIFEPRMKIGQKVSIVSSEPYAGDGKVMKIQHVGMISPSDCGSLETMATFFRSPELTELAS